MSLVDALRGRLAGETNFSSGTWSAEVGDASQRLECVLSALDTLACGLTRLSLHTVSLAGADSGRVRRVAQWLSQQLNYLFEPISPVELDEDRCAVQMRSRPPTVTDGAREYYELTVETGGTIRLERFVKQPGSSRATLPALLTREVLYRLVADFERATDAAL